MSSAASATPRRLRLGLVGYGRIAQDYLAVARELDAYEVCGVTDPDPDARDRAAALDLPTFGSALEMVGEIEVDAALVLTPPADHEQASLELITRGVHVLCEKPVALTATAASRLFHVAARTGVTLMMASKFRYVPDVIEARRLIEDGAIGKPLMFDNAFCSYVDMTERWNRDPKQAGGGVVMDNGSHSVDLARWLVGPLVRVLAHFGRRTQPISVEDTVRMLFETQRAVVGVVDLSWSTHKSEDTYAAVQGDGGALEIGWQGSRYRARDDREWRAFGTGYDKRAALRRQLENFVGTVWGVERPLVTAEDAMAAARAIEAAYRSVRVGRWVPLHGWDGTSV